MTLSIDTSLSSRHVGLSQSSRGDSYLSPGKRSLSDSGDDRRSLSPSKRPKTEMSLQDQSDYFEPGTNTGRSDAHEPWWMSLCRARPPSPVPTPRPPSSSLRASSPDPLESAGGPPGLPVYALDTAGSQYLQAPGTPNLRASETETPDEDGQDRVYLEEQVDGQELSQAEQDEDESYRGEAEREGLEGDSGDPRITVQSPSTASACTSVCSHSTAFRRARARRKAPTAPRRRARDSSEAPTDDCDADVESCLESTTHSDESNKSHSTDTIFRGESPPQTTPGGFSEAEDDDDSDKSSLRPRSDDDYDDDKNNDNDDDDRANHSTDSAVGDLNHSDDRSVETDDAANQASRREAEPESEGQSVSDTYSDHSGQSRSASHAPSRSRATSPRSGSVQLGNTEPPHDTAWRRRLDSLTALATAAQNYPQVDVLELPRYI